MSAFLGVFDAKARFSELVDRATRGEEIIITKRGAAVAKIVPVAKPARTPAEIAEIKDEFRRIRESIAARGVRVTQEDIRAWIDEGRR